MPLTNLPDLNHMGVKIESLQVALENGWSRETCYPSEQKLWTAEKPGFGQCAVTALVVYHYFGGEILEKRGKTGRAFYNRLPDGTIVDLSGQDCDQIDSPERIRDPKSLMHGHTKQRFKLLLSSLNINLES